MNATGSFAPDWLSPPGDTIKDALAYADIPLESFYQLIGIDKVAASGLITGEIQIDESIAGALADAVGSTRRFWLDREEKYRSRLEALKHTQTTFDIRSIASSLPFKEMRSFGWLDDYEGLSPLDALQAFLEDGSEQRLTTAQLMEAVRFRTSFAYESNPASVVAWLRQGGRQARRIECASFESENIKRAIPHIRALTRTKAPKDFFPRLVEICRECGVAVVFVRTPPGCHASGATHFDLNGKAIIQLSFRYRSDDHFWFTVFHEIGHLVLHQDASLFVEGQDFEPTQEEQEANDFAANVLIPPEFDSEIHSVPRNYRQIMRLARRIGVSPGVLVGQMQKRNLLRLNQMNFLKMRYDWATLEAVNP